MQNKLMTAADAIARFVHDGDCIAFGGFSTNRRAYGLVREVIRQKKRDLTVESGSAGGDIDMLIGAGCVKVMNISYIANSGFTMVCRRFREAVEQGTLPVEDYSLDVQTIAYHGAALGLPYVPVKNMLGSDLETVWGISKEERKKYPKLPAKKFVVADDPFSPGSKLFSCRRRRSTSPWSTCRKPAPTAPAASRAHAFRTKTSPSRRSIPSSPARN